MVVLQFEIPLLPLCGAKATPSGLIDFGSNFQAQTAWSWHSLPSPWLALPLLFMFLFFLGTSSGVFDLLWVRVELQAFL